MKKLLIKPILFAAFVIFLGACGSDDDGTAPDPVANFTAAPDNSNPLIIHFTNTSTNASTYEWDFGDGSTSTDKDPSHTYAKGGTYKINLVAAASGKTSEKDGIATSPANLIGGGDMSESGEHFWTLDTLNAPSPTSWEFSEGTLAFWNGEASQTNILAWQPIYVEAGKEYLFSAHVEGGGASNMWFEVYFGTTAPVKGKDYKTGAAGENEIEAGGNGKYISLNTWSGCGGDAVDGDLAIIGCDGTGVESDGVITFANTGVVYFGVKTGVWDGNFTNAVAIDDVSVTLNEE